MICSLLLIGGFDIVQFSILVRLLHIIIYSPFWLQGNADSYNFSFIFQQFSIYSILYFSCTRGHVAV